MSSQFRFRIGQRVWHSPGEGYPGGWVRVVGRTIEPALHKTYLIWVRESGPDLASAISVSMYFWDRKRSYGYVPESKLSAIQGG